MNKNILYARFNIDKFVEYSILFILLIFPKINLFKVFESSHQGIRIEEIVIFFLALFLIFSKKIELRKSDLGYNFFLYFVLFLISSIIGSIYYDQVWIVVLRYIEYLIILLFFNRYGFNNNTILNVIKSFLILNLLFVFLQNFGLFGEFSSLGYQSPENFDNSRPNGLTGGPWELANMSAIFFFTLLLFDKDKSITKNIYLLICISLILISFSRTVYISFSISFLLYYYEKVVDKKKFIAIIVSSIISAVIIIIYFDVFKINKVYFDVFSMFLDFLINKNVYELSYYDPKLWSIAARLQHWLILYNAFLTNNLTILFGSGGIFPYYESTIFRILFCTGFVGFFVSIYMVRKLPIYMLALIIISGLTLDLFLSLKIFFAALLYFYISHPIKRK